MSSHSPQQPVPYQAGPHQSGHYQPGQYQPSEYQPGQYQPSQYQPLGAPSPEDTFAVRTTPLFIAAGVLFGLAVVGQLMWYSQFLRMQQPAARLGWLGVLTGLPMMPASLCLAFAMNAIGARTVAQASTRRIAQIAVGLGAILLTVLLPYTTASISSSLTREVSAQLTVFVLVERLGTLAYQTGLTLIVLALLPRVRSVAPMQGGPGQIGGGQPGGQWPQQQSGWPPAQR